MANASAIFHGTLTEVVQVTVPGGALISPVRATFRVHTVWRGPVGLHLEVVTEIADGACGIGIDFLVAGVGSDFVVYGHSEPVPQLGARQVFTSCLTRTVTFSLEEAEALGQPVWTAEEGIDHLRGDCNGDGMVDQSDAIANLSFQFLGTVDPPCLDACDDDDSGLLDITDAVGSLTRQFLGGPPPPAPGQEICGPDPTEDDLICDSFAVCESNE